MKRGMGRRHWDHWALRVAGVSTIVLLAFAIWFTYGSVKRLEKPHNPHFETDHCFDCHEKGKGKRMSAKDCYRCHDLLTRQKLPNAEEDRKKLTDQPCFHPIKTVDANSGRTVTALCLSCHEKVTGYVALMNIESKTYVEIDISTTHPIGLMPSISTYPKTLPLSRSHTIDCITCHDQHATDMRLHLLRLYYPGNGHPPDFRPLCNDCHEDGWLPIAPEHMDSIRDTRRRSFK